MIPCWNIFNVDKDIAIVSTPFADDFNVIATNSRTHQRILTKLKKMLNQWIWFCNLQNANHYLSVLNTQKLSNLDCQTKSSSPLTIHKKTFSELKLHFPENKVRHSYIFIMVYKPRLKMWIILSLEMNTNLSSTHNMYYLLSYSNVLFMNY